MEDTHLPLRTWLMAFSLMCSAKKGISALQLQRDLNIGSYKTAWRMLKQIRKAMSNIEYGKIFEAIVKIDETYIGGKLRKKNRKDDGDKPNKRGRGTKKNPVVGIVDREKRRYMLKYYYLIKKIDYPVKARGIDATFRKARKYGQRSQQKKMNL